VIEPVQYKQLFSSGAFCEVAQAAVATQYSPLRIRRILFDQKIIGRIERKGREKIESRQKPT
jgi:hypothetical protein